MELHNSIPIRNTMLFVIIFKLYLLLVSFNHIFHDRGIICGNQSTNN